MSKTLQGHRTKLSTTKTKSRNIEQKPHPFSLASWNVAGNGRPIKSHYTWLSELAYRQFCRQQSQQTSTRLSQNEPANKLLRVSLIFFAPTYAVDVRLPPLLAESHARRCARLVCYLSSFEPTQTLSFPIDIITSFRSRARHKSTSTVASHFYTTATPHWNVTDVRTTHCFSRIRKRSIPLLRSFCSVLPYGRFTSSLTPSWPVLGGHRVSS